MASLSWMAPSTRSKIASLRDAQVVTIHRSHAGSRGRPVHPLQQRASRPCTCAALPSTALAAAAAVAPPASALYDVADALPSGLGPYVKGASLLLLAAVVLGDAVPFANYSKQISIKDAARFSTADSGGSTGPITWSGATALTLTPYLWWASWLVIAAREANAQRQLTYGVYAGVYLAPLLSVLWHLTTKGTTPQVDILSGVAWTLCIAHLQIHRVLRTNGVL